MVGFLDLPIEIQNKIYGHVLIIPHSLYLFQDPGSSVDAFAPDRPNRWHALLYINRRVHREASAVLYGMNHFHFVDITPRQVNVLRSFLDCIGSTNAASLSRLCLNFPVAEGEERAIGKIRIRDDSQQSLTLLRQRCTRLSTLELVVHYKNCKFFARTGEFLREALPLIDVELRAIPSLDRIIVRVEAQDQIPTVWAKEVMQELGWSVTFDGV